MNDTCNKVCKDNIRYFQFAGITFQLEYEYCVSSDEFRSYRNFEVNHPGDFVIVMSYHITPLDLRGVNLGDRVYQDQNTEVTEVYVDSDFWRCFLDDSVVVISRDFKRLDRYYPDKLAFDASPAGPPDYYNYPFDAIMLSHVLSEKGGFILHSSAVNFDGNGVAFVGHCGAGKSTIASMLQKRAGLINQDQNIVRFSEEGFTVYSYYHYDALPTSAPLQGVCFLRKSMNNCIYPIKSNKDYLLNLIQFIIKPYPFETRKWWNSILSIAEDLVRTVPGYIVEFDLSGSIVGLLEEIFT